MLSHHGEFDEKFLRVFADEDEGRVGFSVRKLVPVILLTDTIDHVDAAQQTSGRKERRKVHPFN